MPEALLFRRQVVLIILCRHYCQWHAFYGDATFPQCLDFGGIIGHQMHCADTQVAQDLNCTSIGTGISRITQKFICFNRSVALLLQAIGLELAGQPDATSLLGQIEQQSTALDCDSAQCWLQLGLAVAAPRAEDVAGSTGRVQAQQRWLSGVDLAQQQGKVVETSFKFSIMEESERCLSGGKRCFTDSTNTMHAAILGDGSDGQQANVPPARHIQSDWATRR